MTNPEDQKAAQCPFCGSPAQPVNCPSCPHAKCSNTNCTLHAISVPIDQWNTRPREQELEEELAEANEHNDSELPLSEVMKRISEAVMDYQPDLAAQSAGTLPERVETAAECGRGEFGRVKELEGVLRETEETLKACRRQFSLCDGDCEIPHSYTAAISAINAALEEKR